MSIAQSMLPEFDQEMAGTRKMLERLPEDKLDYKPDPKSMALGRLAGHIIEMVGWMDVTLNQPFFDIPPDMKPLAITSRQQALAEFDKNAAASRDALAGATDPQLMETWSLKAGGKEIFSMPRAAVIRSMLMNHVIHHRAQLTVYYRLTGVPVPGLYGPSADEQQAASAN